MSDQTLKCPSHGMLNHQHNIYTRDSSKQVWLVGRSVTKPSRCRAYVLIVSSTRVVHDFCMCAT